MSRDSENFEDVQNSTIRRHRSDKTGSGETIEIVVYRERMLMCMYILALYKFKPVFV